MTEMPSAAADWIPHPWVAEGQARVRFGVFNGPRHDWAELRDFVQLAEALGIDSYWLGDHPMLQPGDCWTQLAALAVSTTSIRLGSLVACVPYRSPALVARMAADVDRLSNGRLVLGLGTGSLPDEFAQLGLPLPSAAERWAAVEEAIEIIQGLWRGEALTYEGRHYQVWAARMPAGPVQLPRVPLLIAGGSRGALRLAGRFADAINMGPHATTGGATSPADARHKLAMVEEHRAAAGRLVGSVLTSAFHVPVVCGATAGRVRAKIEAIPEGVRSFMGAALLAGTPADLIAAYRELVEAGMRYFIASIRGNDVETLRLLAEEVMPAVVAEGGA